TDGKTVPYRRLVLAPGSTFDYFGHPEWEALAPGLKSIDDASAIRSTILSNFEKAETSLDPAEQNRLMTTVVVGGGPTGVEMAGSIAELCRWTLARDFRHIDPSSATVMLVEGMPRLLGGFPDALSDYARSALERLGVKVVTGQMVEDIRPGAITLAGEDIPVGMVIWGAGVRANPAAKWLGVEPADRSGRVAVGDDLAVQGLDGVHVLGDAALVMGDDGPLPGLAQVAKQQGEHLGRALAAAIGESAQIPPFRFKDRGNTAVIGRNAAVFDFGERQLKGRFAWLLWAIVHVYLLMGREKRILVTIQWVWRYFTFQRGARIIR
ncbi:MAG TPA: FAD-dependent oxidoreductase, partial [Methylomirabilota bacterium]|nr:FAD-dependent oxidoreductase [Methylomirabilota bacterium]